MARLLFFFLTISTIGCATISHLDELLTLKSVSDSQKDIDLYLKNQEAGFNKLLADIKDNRLKTGSSKKNIISWYSEPILSKEVENESAIKEALLYRHPVDYFNSDKIYLYFDNVHRLVSWEVRPAK